MTMERPHVIFMALFLATVPVPTSSGHDKHGGVKMGEVNIKCDDGVHGVEVDWDGTNNEPYTCAGNATILPGTVDPHEMHENKTKEPLHRCLWNNITYNDTLPLSGEHRPLWPIYGEYRYIPPQRWLHSLEHAAIVFLYHPCALEKQVEKFRNVVTGCIWKHIISPSKLLSTKKPFALLSWGNGIFMDHFDAKIALQWIKMHGMKDGPEWMVARDGQYKLGLKKKANRIGDGKDTNVCHEYEFEKIGLARSKSERSRPEYNQLFDNRPL